jgi:hypothetical protein
MQGINVMAPLAVIDSPTRIDNVFLKRADIDRDSYPADATVKVYAPGGRIIATKAPGATRLTIANGVDLEKIFKGLP